MGCENAGRTDKNTVSAYILWIFLFILEIFQIIEVKWMRIQLELNTFKFQPSLWTFSCLVIKAIKSQICSWKTLMRNGWVYIEIFDFECSLWQIWARSQGHAWDCWINFLRRQIKDAINVSIWFYCLGKIIEIKKILDDFVHEKIFKNTLCIQSWNTMQYLSRKLGFRSWKLGIYNRMETSS